MTLDSALTDIRSETSKIRSEADRLRREGAERLLEADALDKLCDDLEDLAPRINALVAQ